MTADNSLFDSEEEVQGILNEGVADGLFEIAEENNNPGESRFKLTDYGRHEAERSIASKGLPFLVALSSRKAINDGKDRTVKSMADEIIKKFPNRLKREAKKNFAPFWGEFSSWSPQDYLEAYQEARSDE